MNSTEKELIKAKKLDSDGFGFGLISKRMFKKLHNNAKENPTFVPKLISSITIILENKHCVRTFRNSEQFFPEAVQKIKDGVDVAKSDGLLFKCLHCYTSAELKRIKLNSTVFSSYYEGIEDLPDPNRSSIVPILDPSDDDREEETPLSFAERERQCEQEDTNELGVGILVYLPSVDGDSVLPGKIIWRQCILVEYWDDRLHHGMIIESLDQYKEKNKKVPVVRKAIAKLQRKKKKFIPFGLRELRRKHLSEVHIEPEIRRELAKSAQKFSYLTLDLFRKHGEEFGDLGLIWKTPADKSFRTGIDDAIEYWKTAVLKRRKAPLCLRSDQSYLAGRMATRVFVNDTSSTEESDNSTALF